MKAQELRIGNLVEYNGIMWVVLSITYPSPRNDNYSDKWLLELSNGGIITVTLDECKPITLTEEWLERFGFENRKRKLKSGVAIEVTINFIGSVMYSINGKHWVDISDCRYVHQLQNLYFALTGEELQTD